VAVSRALRRLLRVLEIEEEQSRAALESALSDLRRLEQALAAAAERDRGGRRLVAASAYTGQLPDRLAGLEETRAATRHATSLVPCIADAKRGLEAVREDFLAKRVERRQAETLIREAEARDAVETTRRAQQALDDWYRNRPHPAPAAATPANSDAPQTALGKNERVGGELEKNSTLRRSAFPEQGAAAPFVTRL